MICHSLLAPLFTICTAPAAQPPPASLPIGPTIVASQRSGKKSHATPKVQYYDGEWEVAQKDALERNVPILLVAMTD